MSKIADDRPRYIAMKITAERKVSRRAFQNAVRGHGRKAGIADEFLPQLTRFEFPHAIVRVEHGHDHKTRAMLAGMDWAIDNEAKVPLTIETLSASGTIKTLTERLGILVERGEKKPDAPPGGSAKGGRASGGAQSRQTAARRSDSKPPRAGGDPRLSPGANKVPGALRGGGPAAPPGAKRRD